MCNIVYVSSITCMYPCLYMLLKVLAEYALQLCACSTVPTPALPVLVACAPVRIARGYTPGFCLFCLTVGSLKCIVWGSLNKPPSSSRPLSLMPVVSEVRHPQSLDFANERKTLLLRDVHGLSWAAIQEQVVNLRGETPSVRLLQRLHQDVNRDLGRRVYKYSNCGRKATKATATVQKYLVGRLLVLRRRTTCTATTLRRELLANKGVDLEESTIRKILRDHGYKWLPRAQKRKYSAAKKKERLKFAKAVLRLTKAKLREKLSMAMDGVILSLPPRDATERANYCAHGDTHMWRLPGEAASEELAGQDPYPYQIPADRVVPLWGGLSEGGFALVTFHHARKLTSAAWCREVRRGKLAKAIQSLSPVRPAGPWTVLCDNEAFLHTAASKRAMAAAGVRAWRVPASSPDLNPVEKMWAWLRRRIRVKDCEDLRRRRPPIGKMAFKARLRSMLASKQAQHVAARIAAGFRATCKEVVSKQGGMARG